MCTWLYKKDGTWDTGYKRENNWFLDCKPEWLPFYWTVGGMVWRVFYSLNIRVVNPPRVFTGVRDIGNQFELCIETQLEHVHCFLSAPALWMWATLDTLRWKKVLSPKKTCPKNRFGWSLLVEKWFIFLMLKLLMPRLREAGSVTPLRSALGSRLRRCCCCPARRLDVSLHMPGAATPASSSSSHEARELASRRTTRAVKTSKHIQRAVHHREHLRSGVNDISAIPQLDPRPRADTTRVISGALTACCAWTLSPNAAGVYLHIPMEKDALPCKDLTWPAG